MSFDAAAAPDVAGGRTKINEVWHVRHGQKCYEVKGEERELWKQSSRHKKVGYFDVLITRHGHVQASRAGLYLKSLPFHQQPGGFDIVYTSPMARTVQTAVCVSQGLGNLPLQVVPGLCSCTAAMERIGPAAQKNLMTDQEIKEIFPWITVIPRDPLAPTTFSESAAWLAAKATEKKSAEDSGDGDGDGDGDDCVYSRVLVIGHQEGTKAMAGGQVPTPHCCIGIFRTKASENAYKYELHDLLSNTGTSINPSGESSSYAGPTMTTTGEDNTPHKDGGDLDSSGEDDGGSAAIAVAEKVIGLTVSSVNGARIPVV